MTAASLPGIALLSAVAFAPLQCPSRHPPEIEREETPGEALWILSERFASEGNHAASRDTLMHLIERFPRSRFAVRARTALDAGVTTPPR